jgi:hypothetical protein
VNVMIMYGVCVACGVLFTGMDVKGSSRGVSQQLRIFVCWFCSRWLVILLQ